jgi:peroxiredoxin
LKEVKEENYKITEMLISIGQVIPQINNAICNSQIKQNNDILDGLTNRHKVLKYSD